MKAERSKWFHYKSSRFLFFQYKFLKKLRKNYSKFAWLPGKIAIVIQWSSSNFMKSLLIICSKSAKVTSKQYLGAILIRLFFRIKLFKVIHPVERKISWNFSWILTKRCSNAIVLFFTVETERVQSLMRTLAQTNFKSI